MKSIEKWSVTILVFWEKVCVFVKYNNDTVKAASTIVDLIISLLLIMSHKVKS